MIIGLMWDCVCCLPLLLYDSLPVCLYRRYRAVSGCLVGVEGFVYLQFNVSANGIMSSSPIYDANSVVTEERL